MKVITFIGTEKSKGIFLTVDRLPSCESYFSLLRIWVQYFDMSGMFLNWSACGVDSHEKISKKKLN